MVSPMHAFYTRPGPMSDPKQYLGQLLSLPAEVPALRDVVQGLTVHIFWSKRYGLDLDEARQAEVQLRPVWRKYARLAELNAAPLWQPRPLDQKLVCNCRDISLLLVSMLISKGTPARARCGFGTYFMPNHFEDHWVVEYWNTGEGRWVMVDAQLDALQCEVLGISFNPLDMPAGQFVTGGQAWQMCRAGQADPDTFGIFEYKGLDFVRGNLLRDFLALNRVEVLPWDFWGVLMKPVAECGTADLALMDHLAELTCQPEEGAFKPMRAVYEQHPELHIPQDWAA